MVQNEWNIYYCIYNMNHFIYIMKTMNVFNRFLLCCALQIKSWIDKYTVLSRILCLVRAGWTIYIYMTLTLRHLPLFLLSHRTKCVGMLYTLGIAGYHSC